MRPPSQFGDDITNQANNEPDPRMGAMMICTRLAGRAIIRVVGRCNEAQENNNLDLSGCQLMQVPEAVYHLMRHTELKTCDLSGNEITKITPKLALKFKLITDLNLSHNLIAKLPEEIADLANLLHLDISHNTFIALPNSVLKIPNLQQLKAHDNSITEIDIDCIREAPALEMLDLTNNPIPPRSHDALSSITTLRILITPREKEDWEDLTI